MSDNRFVDKTFSELQDANDSPIFGYEDLPLLTLEESVEKLIPLVPHVMDYVRMANKKCNHHSSLLTRDESAAIYLYTMPNTSFFQSFNITLRNKDRNALKPWFAFLKLFVTALNKLPSVTKLVWRGVCDNVSSPFDTDDIHIWWNVNSCSVAINVVEAFLGNSGTLFFGTHVRQEMNRPKEQQSKSNYLFDQIRQEYLRNNRLHHLINPAQSFSIEQSYINLVIVNAKDQREKEKQMHNIQHSDAIMGTYEDIYGVKTTIDVKDILQSCKGEKKQVLVFGRAGIGKSTFCRYIAYQWARGSYWSHYELVALIPLRRLTADRYPSNKRYLLIDLVKKEVFSFELSKKEEQIFEKHFDPKKTLWILDGYEEIRGNIPSHLGSLFEHLLNTPHHIITSRPYLNTLSYEIQVEITGFTDKNIEEYVHQFFNQMENKSENETIKKDALLKFLESNRTIWSIAHIPVNLELICSVWSNRDLSETRNLTITTLYTTITEWLCRRYLKAQNHEIQLLSEEEVYEHCQKELTFLESLAFHAMDTNTIIIRPPLLKKVLEETKLASQDYLKILKIGLLKSFYKETTGVQLELKKDHYFIHLSFQEYFAARYLIRALNQPSTQATMKAFINYQKYNQRYTLVFNFMAGLLGETYSTSYIQTFWNIILGEPLDLVGIRHIQLIIFCMDATSDYSIVPYHTELIQWIGECIQYYILKANESILIHILRSLGTAETITNNDIIINMFILLLQNNDTVIKKQTLSVLSQLNISEQLNKLISSVTTSLNHEDVDVRASACEALEKMGKKAATNEVINKLVSALGDQNEDVRWSAREALGNMADKATTDEVIDKLVSAVGDQNEDVRANACAALGKISEKAATNEVINKLVSALGDQKAWVRKSACDALRKMGGKAATNEVINKLVSALGDQDGYVRSSACGALGEMGEKGATNEVITMLLNMISKDIWRSFIFKGVIRTLLKSSSVLVQLDSKHVLDFYRSKRGFDILGSISLDALVSRKVIEKDVRWRFVLTHCALLRGAAIVLSDNKLMIYDGKEPIEKLNVSSDLRSDINEAFDAQKMELQLSFKIPS